MWEMIFGLGFRPGDIVRNIYDRSMYPSEHHLVCRIRDKLWWAWDETTNRLFQVSVGDFWVLSEQRTVQRGKRMWRFVDGRWGWRT